jgi:Signal peptide peptidase
VHCALQAAQPALLYIVPAVLGAVALHAHLRGEFTQVRHGFLQVTL